MDFRCSDAAVWRDALASYQTRVESLSLAKTDLVRLDDFYTKQLPLLLRQRNPTPYISKTELSTLMQWKLTRGKWRPRLMDFVSSLDEPQVQSASERAFQSLPDIAKAITELTTLKGVGPATASAVLAAYAPEIAPFMSDEAMVAAIGSSKDYTLKQYLIFAEKLQTKAKEMQKVQAHMGSIQTESDIQMRSLLEKSAKMKADIRAGGSLRKDLQQAHVEAQSLITARQELNTQIRQTTLELQKAHADAKKLPEMQAELDSLRQEHQKLRVAFEYEKGSNIDQVERMHAMERNLISLAREVEKLRAEVLNAEKKARAPNSYGGAYGSPDAPYPPVGQGGGFVDAYGRPQVQMSRGTSMEGTKLYGGNSAVADAGIVASASGNASGVWGGTYDTVSGVPFLAQK